MVEDFDAQDVDGRGFRGRAHFRHMGVETRNRVVDNVRQSWPIPIDAALLRRAVERLGVPKISVDEARENHATKEPQAIGGRTLVSPTNCRGHQARGDRRNFLSPGGIKGVNFPFQTSVEACLVADRVREPGMMPSYGVRKNLRDQSVVRLCCELHGQLRARGRMVHLQRGAFETPLESRRIFPKIVDEAGKRRRVRCAEFCAAPTGTLRHRSQVFDQRLPTLLLAVLKRVRKKDALSFGQSLYARLALPAVSIGVERQRPKVTPKPAPKGLRLLETYLPG